MDADPEYVTLKTENLVTSTDRHEDEAEDGALRQPVEVPALYVLRCGGCGQVLPPGHQPPMDEPWSTSILDCTLDRKNMLEGAFCPCLLFGRNVESLRDDISLPAACLCHALVVEGGVGAAAVLACLSPMLDPGTCCLLSEFFLLSWWMCAIYAGLLRQALQRKYHLQNAPCDPCLVHCFLHQCALCQEYREMKHRLSLDDTPIMTDPPIEQEMSSQDVL